MVASVRSSNDDWPSPSNVDERWHSATATAPGSTRTSSAHRLGSDGSAAWVGRACSTYSSGVLEEVVLVLHASNGVFPPYRYRWPLSVERLDWVPSGFGAFRDAVLAPVTADPEANLALACQAFDDV